MSNIPINNLPSVLALTGAEEIPAVQANTTVRITAQQIADLATTGGTVTEIVVDAPLSGGTITSTGTIGLQANSITNAYLAPMAPYTIKGNATAGTVVPQDLTVTETLDMLGIGSIASNQLLGNISGSVANPSAFTLSDYIDAAISNVQGSLLYRNATEWNALAPSIAGQVLSTNGVGADPTWISVAGTGTVTQIDTGTGLTGGPILTSGTISIANTAVTAGTYGSASSVPTYQVNAQGQLTSATNVNIAIDASAVTTGILPIARGGTNNASTPINGQLLIGDGTGYALNTISAGAGMTVTNGAGSISIGITNTAVASGSYGSSSSVSTFTVNSQGQLTAAASVPINAIALTTGTISTTPSNATDIANKDYVDSVAQGLNFHAACNYASVAAYTATYYNGPANNGVGATLTNSGANAAFSIDGVTMTSGNIGNRMLIKDMANSAYNGVYTLTTVGDGSTPWVLARATDYDTSGSGTNEIDAGDFFLILSGNTQANTSWVQQTLLPIIIGTTGIVFTQFGAPITYTAGTGLSLAGTIFSIANTAVTANSYGSASSVPTFTVNAQGQLTAASNTNIAIDASAVTSGTLAVARGGTGTTTSTGSGSVVLNTSPSFVTPNLGVASASGLTVSKAALASFTGSTIGNTYLADVAATSNYWTTLDFGTTGGVMLARIGMQYTGSGSNLSIGTSNSILSGVTNQAFNIDSNGNVGIGTTSPAVKLSISSTDSILIPVGTTAQRPTGATGYLRFNSDTSSFEGYNGTAWGSIGGGATGGGTDQIFYLNGQTVTTNYSIPSGQNAGTFGPVTVNSGATVTIPAGSTWSIV